MNELEKRAHYVTTVMQDFEHPLGFLFNSMPKRWKIYAIDLMRKFYIRSDSAVTFTYIYGCSNCIWIREGEGEFRTIRVKVSCRGHIYLE